MKHFISFRYVFWYHNDRMINFDSERGIAVTTTPGRRTHSQLSISRAEVSDSGNYTCAPSNSLPASIQVYVSGMKCFKNLTRSEAKKKKNTHSRLSLALI